jgi:hypothetical protein
MRRLLKLIIENKNKKVKLRDLSIFTNKNSLLLIIIIIKNKLNKINLLFIQFLLFNINFNYNYWFLLNFQI